VARRTGRDLLPLVQPLATDPSVAVRREAALSLRDLEASAAAPVWAELAARHDGADRWYLEALGIAADGRWELFLPAWEKLAGGQWNTPAGRDLIWRSRTPAA